MINIDFKTKRLLERFYPVMLCSAKLSPTRLGNVQSMYLYKNFQPSQRFWSQLQKIGLRIIAQVVGAWLKLIRAVSHPVKQKPKYATHQCLSWLIFFIQHFQKSKGKYFIFYSPFSKKSLKASKCKKVFVK